MDFANPPPGYGVCNEWFPSATSRSRSELVLGLAVAHHFVFGRHRLSLDEVARGFASFCDDSLLVEFVPLGADANANPREWRPDSEGWYNLERFADAFAQELDRVNVLVEDPDSACR